MITTPDYVVTWSPGMSLESLELNVIQKAYRFYKENKTSTAHALGISIRTLDSRLEAISKINEEERTRHERATREREIFLNRSRGVQTNQTADEAAGRIETKQRPRLEPSANSTAEPEVSVFVGKEVQEVLPKSAAASGHGRRRG